MEHQHRRNDLALTIINTGEGYKERCDAARMSAGNGALVFTSIARQAARTYEKASDCVFTTADILAVANEIAEYYADHVKEMEAHTSPQA